MVDPLRLRSLNTDAVRPDGDYVLYWMTAARRPNWNHALDRAVERAREWDRPLLVLEALGCRHRWAAARTHRFLMDGMADNAEAFAGTAVTHRPWVEERAGDGSGLLAALGRRACVVVTDDWPCFNHPALQAAAARQLDVRLEAVDGNGVVPMAAADKAFARAFDFRRFLQGCLAGHLGAAPRARPLSRLRLPPLGALPPEVERRWPATPPERLRDDGFLASLPVDQEVGPTPWAGGHAEAERRARAFLSEGLPDYAERSRHPDDDAVSGLSPWLHFGHLSSHRVVARILADAGVDPDDLPREGGGQREGWWGLDPSAESFLDQLVTWRELGFNHCAHRDDADRYEGLPGWARETLEQHAGDPRDTVYTLEQLERAETDDEIWNAAQRQLLAEGRIHNYLRMLWGKRILGWTAHPREAHDVMVALNDRHALDGRDPNSYSGIGWVLGRYDRAWGPERPVFGKVRYMSSENTRRKLRLKGYLERWSAGGSLFG